MRLRPLKIGKSDLQTAMLTSAVGRIDPNLLITDANSEYSTKIAVPGDPGLHYTIKLNLPKIWKNLRLRIL